MHLASGKSFATRVYRNRVQLDSHTDCLVLYPRPDRKTIVQSKDRVLFTSPHLQYFVC